MDIYGAIICGDDLNFRNATNVDIAHDPALSTTDPLGLSGGGDSGAVSTIPDTWLEQ